ncbi:Gene Transfer Agent (GTA) [Candidatus Rhodobacter oscarellae]|uniref:Gene Transfer Agent (GTA) n=1 Tax=Candidatus Rhodobacter oscarellae TaxID=1675527 RepID=A0A0J9E0Y4_9RHOB|nr:DUF3168 domain-containing protein [Candidatus Rhodobacter lobularis]KMW56581.1 Gene Transfer Agent (GTA) [Candidatus Rhodobacter lobularis]
MSYAMAAALQTAVFQRLETDLSLTALVGTAIYDAAPPGTIPGTYLVLGPEEVRDRSDASQAGAAHDFIVTVVSDGAGFQNAKNVATVVSDALVDADLVLSRGRLISLRFVRAKADRMSRGTQRKIDLRFRALVEDT